MSAFETSASETHSSETTASPTLRSIRPTRPELAARRSRNRAIGLVLVGLVGLFYVMTLAKLGMHLPFGG